MRSNLKILFVIGQLDQGGAERQFYHLLSEFSEPASVLSMSSGGYWAAPIRQRGYEVIELQRSKHWEWRRLVATVNILREKRPEIVHIFCDGVGALYARLAALIVRHPLVVVGERIVPAYYPAWYRFLLPHFNRGVKAVVCNSKTAAHYMETHRVVRPDKLYYIPNCIDAQAYSDTNRAAASMDARTEKPLVVGTVASLTHKKNPALFIRAAARVHRVRPDVRFWMIGDGPLRQPCQALIEQLGLHEVVKLWGKRDDIPALLARMAVFVLTSRYEGTPNAILEAMAVGLPCVVTDVGDAGRIVRQAQAGYVVDAEEKAPKLSQAILTLLGDAHLRSTMGQRGHIYIQHRHTPAQMASLYQALYSELLARAAEPASP